MAFTGTAVIVLVTDSLVRITGLSLAAAAVGTISLFGGAGEEVLPDGAKFVDDGDIDLAEAVQVSFNWTTTVGAGVANAIEVLKTTGPFLITMTNDSAATSPEMDIYIRFH